MLKTIPSLALACVCSFSLHLAMAQQPQAPAQQAAAAVAEPEAPRVVLQAEATTSVLRLMKFSGALRDRTGNARTGAVGLTFALYKEQQGGAPLWLEVHNALLDEQGRYTVLLGSIKSDGLPLELFSTGEARWLGVQLNLPGEEEQSRVLLVSVPYALKAADAETLGGKPPSAFLLAEPVGADPSVRPEAVKAAVKEGPGREQVVGTITGEGTANMVSKFTGANTIGDGSLFDNGFVGVGNTNPLGKLTVTHPLSGSVTKALLLESHYDLNSGAKIVFDSLSNNGERASLGYSIASGGGGELFFNTSQQGGFPAAERMRITNTGSVGIGSSNPFGKLTVTNPVAGSVSKGLLLESHYDLNSGSKIVFDSLSNNGERASIGYSIVSGGGGDIFFNTSPQGGFPVSERMRITSTGNVGIGTATPGQKLTVAGMVESTSGGFKFPDSTTQTTALAFGGTGAATTVARSDHTHALASVNTTGVGASALAMNSGSGNTAVGALALDANTSGANNTALGANALGANQTGQSNTAVGLSALLNNTASFNTAVGSVALEANTSGTNNTALGFGALRTNQTGQSNTAVGLNALTSSTGTGNIALGSSAGASLTSGNSNIYVGNTGSGDESNTIRIGSPSQTRAFIAGIRNVTTANMNAIAVLIDSVGQLGTTSSSARVKEDIRHMGPASRRLLRLRPVTFRYRQAATDGSKPLQYGLIAEQVAEVMPELVAYDESGQPETVFYHVLPSLLLNEVQRQEARLEAQQAELDSLRRELAELKAQQARLTAAGK